MRTRGEGAGAAGTERASKGDTGVLRANNPSRLSPNPEFMLAGCVPDGLGFVEEVLPSTGRCMSAEVCAFDVAVAWRAGKRHVAAVFNTDRRNQSRMLEK
jgi:hypothetical protein